MIAPLEAVVARVIAEHFYGAGSQGRYCRCGAMGTGDRQKNYVAHVAAVLAEAGVGFVAEAEDNTQKLVDQCVHYRNLAVLLGAKPEQMLSEFDRDLAANHAGDIAENFDFDIDSTEAWEAAERAEAALEKVRALADRADARADASTRLVTTADLRAAIGGTP